MDITSLPTYRIAELCIARAFQIAKPFPDLSVERNIYVASIFGRSGSRDSQAVTESVIELCSLGSLRSAPASSLSVGNLRRLELARATAARPRVLLADEPCAGLNETETREGTEIMKKIRR